MKRLSFRAKLTLMTDIALIFIITAVFTVSFLPERIIPIYGGEKNYAIYNGSRERPNVSLMFNVYEGTEIVKGIVDLLDQSEAKATFFVGGCWADDNAEMLKYIIGHGHELGNHGYFHKDHKTLDYSTNREEIYLTGVVTEALCGAKLNLFAPPSGSFSQTTLDACYDLGYTAIMWSKDTIDWRDSDVTLIYSRATKNAQNGDFILMHPKNHTLKALPDIIRFYKEAGYNLVTVSENLQE